jgi:hypothetical protein
VFFELVIVVCIGLSAAGIVLAATKPFGIKGGKVLAPLAAALAMLCYQAWSRSTWAEHVVKGLGPDAVVIERLPVTSPFEPWSYVRPMVGGLVVLDRKTILTHPHFPGMKLVTTRLIEAHEETLELHHLVDCAGGRRAVVESLGALENGAPAQWIDGREPAALFDAVCPGG